MSTLPDPEGRKLLRIEDELGTSADYLQKAAFYNLA